MCVDTFVLDNVDCGLIATAIDQVPFQQNDPIGWMWALGAMVVLLFGYAILITSGGGGNS